MRVTHWWVTLVLRILLTLSFFVAALRQRRRKPVDTESSDSATKSAMYERPKSSALDTRAVDGLRAITALHIVVYHFLLFNWGATGKLLWGGIDP